MVMIMPQAIDCWAVHGGKFPKNPSFEGYFTKEDPQYKFTQNLIAAAKGPIDEKYDYKARQDITMYKTYDMKIFEF